MCQTPQFTTVEVPILQNQLALNENVEEDKISEIELKCIRNKIGIKGITVTIEEQRAEPFIGSIDRLSLNADQTELTTSR